MSCCGVFIRVEWSHGWAYELVSLPDFPVTPVPWEVIRW